MSLRELALVGQGAAWLPGSLIRSDLEHGRLLPLTSLGRSVRMDIVVFFAILGGEKGERLMRTFDAVCGATAQALPATRQPVEDSAATSRST